VGAALLTVCLSDDILADFGAGAGQGSAGSSRGEGIAVLARAPERVEPGTLRTVFLDT